ncbi:hypothetical protein EW026_g813 [Hermanssonia centrifuga]|uniref:Uncharacterized protein n=1 Tax=Hermanssonia centrifuga TaxID=98765 RepID=A0A4S4KTN7_9APHY|nr:hypothetical protein EW026_g813 [Hermanssonia centrifuga]
MPSEHEVKTRAEQLKYFADYFLDADEDLRKDSDDDDPKEKQLNILFTYPPAPPLDIHDPMWFVNMLRAFREEREQMQYRMQGLRDMAFEALVEADIAEAEMHAERVQLKLLMDRIARLAGKAFVDMVLQRKADGEGAASGLSDMETDPLPATPLKSPSQTMPPPPVPQQDGRGRMQSRPTTPKRPRIRSTSRDSADDLADDERSHKRSRLFDPSPSPPPSPGPVDNVSHSPGGIHVLSPNPADSSPSPIKDSRVPPPGLKKRKNCPSRGKIGDMKGTRFHNGTTNLKAVFDKKRASLGKKLQDQPPHMPKRHVPLPGAPVARMSVGLPYANPAFFDPRTGMPYPAIASALRNAGLPNEGVVGTPQGGTSQSTATGIVQNMALPYINTAVYNPSSFASGSQTQQSPQTHPRSPSGSAGPSSPPVLARNNALPRRPPVRREHTVVYCFAPEAAIEAGAGAKVQEPQEGPQAAAAAAPAQVAAAGPVRLLEVEASTPPQRVSPKDRCSRRKRRI